MADPKEKTTLIEFTEKQTTFAEAVFSGKYSFLLFGGAIRGGKSVVTLSLIIILCRIYPGSRWAIVRKDLPTLRRTTIPTFETIKPKPFVGEINKTIWSAQCQNESEILFFPESLKEDPDLDRWKGLEVNGFVLEEANELSEATFSKTIERAGSWTCPGEQPTPVVMLTCNPAKNWVKRKFYDPWKLKKLEAPFFFLQALPGDNPHLPQVYLDSLEQLKETDPRAYARFVRGDWESADDPDQLIKFEWVLNAKSIEREPGKKRLGVDVARYGDDDTVLCLCEGNTIKALEYHHGLSVDRVAALVQAKINEETIDADRVFVDTVGLGAGVADILISNGYEVQEVVSGAGAIDRLDSLYKFKDLRSQLWWEFREKLRRGELCFDVEDHRLIEDLTAPRYTVSGDKVLKVESKDEIRKRIGRSTDAGDAAVYADANLDDGGFEFSGNWKL